MAYDNPTDASQQNALPPDQMALVDQGILQGNYDYYLGMGGNPSLAQLNPGTMTFSQGTPNPNDPLGGAGGGGYGLASGYAPYEEGGGHTKWDEFVQQMQMEQQKLQNAIDVENVRAKNAIDVENIRAQEQKYAEGITSVDDLQKALMAEQGPKDPYSYLFNSRGLNTPQGYAPVGMALTDAQRQAYQDSGVSLADAQKSIVGSAGPSFINGYLGSLPQANQQGPMGFQNTPQFTGATPGSQQQQDMMKSLASAPSQSGQPAMQSGPQKMAMGGIVPGHDMGRDTVPAMLRPGEGVLKPEVVNEMGGPNAISALNAQHFADGGVAGYTPPTVDTPQGTLPAGSSEPAIPSGYTLSSPGVATPTQQSPMGGGDLTLGGIDQPMDFNRGIPGGDWIGEIERHFGFGGNGPTGIDQPVGWNQFRNLDPGGWQDSQPQPLPAAPIGSPIGPILGGPYNPTPGGPIGPILSGPFGPTGLHNPLDYGPKPAEPIGNQPYGNMDNPNAPLLTGGVLAPTGPGTPPPMNLNMLDPYTRSLVDQYGRPQIPSMQAWDAMPQSGKDAYTNYVEKVAGGNMQDLLDEQKQMAPQGDAAALRNTMTFT